MLLNDISVSTPSKEIMVPFWREVMTASKDTSPGMDHRRPIVEELWAPISEHEIRKALPNVQTAAGPDSITARQMKRIPAEVLVRILNVILWCEKAPLKFLELQRCTKEIQSKRTGGFSTHYGILCADKNFAQGISSSYIQTSTFRSETARLQTYEWMLGQRLFS